MKADVLALVDYLSLGKADSDVVESLYSDVCTSLAQFEMETSVTVLPHTATADLQLDESIIQVLGVCYGDDWLGQVLQRQVAAGNESWEVTRGRPIAWTFENEPDRALRLIPTPVEASDDFLGWDILGANFPNHSVVVLHTRNPGEHLTPVLDLPVAFLILAREFARPSDHTDTKFSALCQTLANLFLVGTPGFVPPSSGASDG